MTEPRAGRHLYQICPQTKGRFKRQPCYALVERYERAGSGARFPPLASSGEEIRVDAAVQAARTRWERCSSPAAECLRMLVNPVMTIFRVLTWCCVVGLAVLSLWPGKGLGFLYVLPELNTMRIGLPGQLEHFIAYAGSAAVGIAGYGASRGNVRVVGGFWVYAAILEYLQRFSPGRHPSIEDFAASALGALCGGLAVAFLWRRWFDQPR
jgi:hypothetical protein